MDKEFTGTYVPVMHNKFIAGTAQLSAIIMFCLTVTTHAVAQQNVGVTGKPDFYFSIRSQDGNLREYRSKIVPNIPLHVCYGWRLKLVNVTNIVQFTEKFSLPSEPAFWSSEDNSYATSAISKDRKTSVTKKYVVPEEGWIGNSWCVVEGDPLGVYKMRIFVSDVPIGEISFEIVSLADYRKRSAKD
ncbi:MAG: hypothetical protein GY948_15610 [Alphaproteobacteria bacterium]|nr:hypothetical protein [Alphaproteobacteria bacterium]